MNDLYRIQTDPHRNLVVLRLRGCWTETNFHAFQTEMRRAIRAVRSPTRGFVCLTVANELAVQPQRVVELFQAFLAEPGIAAERTAFITPSMLSRRQASRIDLAAEQRVFDNEKDALEWLTRSRSVSLSDQSAGSRAA